MSCDLVPVDAYPEIVDDVTLTTRRNIDGSGLEVEETVRRKTTTTFHDRKIAAWALPGHAENVLVDAISYVPTDEQIEEILEKGNDVISSAKGGDGDMDVKEGSSMKRVPCDPSKSAWFVFETAVKGVSEQKELYGGDESDFVMVFDPAAAPMSGSSMGMNGILTNFGGNNENRVNLFVGTKDNVFDLLGRFLRFRCEHQDLIVKQTIENMSSKGQSSALLDLALEVVEKNEKTSFASLGIGLRSFCQTWDVDTKKPNFSQQSPHFQTKVVVRDPARLFNELRAYEGTKEVNELCGKFVDYGNRVLELKVAFLTKGYAKKFVDVDALYMNMAATRDMDDLAGLVLAMLGTV